MLRSVSVIAAVVSFAVTALLGYVVIPMLQNLKFGQTILEIGPKWHKEKEGTPTMGGIMIMCGLIAAIIVSFLCGLIFNFNIVTNRVLGEGARLIGAILLALLMGGIGFLDDYIKIKNTRNLGLTAKQKTFMQFTVSVLYLLFLRFAGGMTTTRIPFFGSVDISHGIGLIFWPIALFFIYGFTNAVNLTDGLDGLAASVTVVVSCFFMLASGVMLNFSCNTLASSLAGACAGFAIWNYKPAKVFMGDTGSMFLGGTVVGISFLIDMPIILILAGCMYFIEAISVMLQVGYYKLTKKRLFKMAPLHHHFELKGYSEQKIVLLFSLIAAAGCTVAFILVRFA
ncbi:MAG: phospho-N-acetylmuramoyl-pentapeptide-transferase [Clostridia bacterium]|nr:phospho-N-acetylmuramoyl-pentapeptide-transferase [Clostridia bacterium]